MTRPTVLFACVHNAGRSQMAAGWLRHLAGDRIEVLSAGSMPGDAIKPVAVAAMAEVGTEAVRPNRDEIRGEWRGWSRSSRRPPDRLIG